ncbi:hypothetical protein GYA19_05490 [Candidatus Beckwithbacteria bacterium]|nr:hypothetical protein [Candidatus Beckwithbacteria bacterium]
MKNNQYLIIGLTIFLVMFYFFLRFYKIQTSLLFFNDIGRDFLVLYDWEKSLKPPLLGPQTSALPFNQSAAYFYFLMPFYLLTNHSLFATLYANAFFYTVLFLLGVYFLRKKPILQTSLLITFFLLTIHPQQITQSRFVWNPSFVSGFILVSFYFWQILKKNFNNLYLICFTLSLAFAISFNYSAVPTLVAFMLYAIFIFKKKVLKIYLFTFLNLILVNSPTIFFELRHQFLLTKMLLYQEKIKQQGLDLFTKLTNLQNFTFPHFSPLLFVCFCLLIILFIYLSFKKFQNKERNIYLQDSLVLTLLTFFITMIAPIGVQNHYIFGILPLLFLVISFLEIRSSLFISLVLASVFLQPANLKDYFQPATRTAEEIVSCSEMFCSQEKEPMFVSGQSGLRDFLHNAMEFKYLFKESGCTIKDLDTQITEAQKMVVVADNATYEHNKTSFNELTQFGKSEEIKIYTCKGGIKLHILQRVQN